MASAIPFILFTFTKKISTFLPLTHISYTKGFLFFLSKIFHFFMLTTWALVEITYRVHHVLLWGPSIYHCVFIAHLAWALKVCLYLLHVTRPCISSCTFYHFPNNKLYPRELISYPRVLEFFK